jgi:hypothetical protein
MKKKIVFLVFAVSFVVSDRVWSGPIGTGVNSVVLADSSVLKESIFKRLVPELRYLINETYDRALLKLCWPISNVCENMFGAPLQIRFDGFAEHCL